jgi:sodium/hydrogen exchanger 10/11
MHAIYFFRGFVIALFSPILKHTGYGLTWREGTVMTWGGLRGAVGLALALQVAHHDRIDQETVGNRVSFCSFYRIL